jgi:hypothetical protein
VLCLVRPRVKGRCEPHPRDPQRSQHGLIHRLLVAQAGDRFDHKASNTEIHIAVDVTSAPAATLSQALASCTSTVPRPATKERRLILPEARSVIEQLTQRQALGTAQCLLHPDVVSDELTNRIIKPDHAALNEAHRRHCRDQLRNTCDPKAILRLRDVATSWVANTERCSVNDFTIDRHCDRR